MTRYLREPLVHFLLIGALLFAWSGSPVDVGNRTILVTEQQAGRLALAWSGAWGRPPTPTELEGLIRDHIKEEVYYREALRLGLDKDDAFVRRRMRMKMETLASDAAEAAVPSDADLKALLDADPERYAGEPRYTFDQVYAGDKDASALLASLNAGADPAALGAPLSLPRTLDAVPRSAIARQFGDTFAAALETLPRTVWVGPVESGFGLHLVRIRARQDAPPSTVASLRGRLENDWLAATRARRETAAYQALLDGYTIRIEQP